MKRLTVISLLFVFAFSFSALAAKTIPPAPTVQSAEYKYFAIFYNSYFEGYYIQYSSSPISVSGDNNITFNPSNSSRFYWSPKANYTDWIQTSSSDRTNLNVTYNKYLGGNCVIKDSSNNIIYSQSSTSLFLDHVVSNYGYSPDWTDPVFSGSGGGGGIIDVSGIISGLKNLLNAIVSLPGDIVDGVLDMLKGLFIPSDGFFEGKMNYLVDRFTVAFGISPYDMSGMFSSETALSDVKVTLYGSTVTILRTEYVKDALKVFRKVIRGFICLLLVFYNINQFLGFIGQAPLTLGALIGIRDYKDSRSQGED